MEQNSLLVSFSGFLDITTKDGIISTAQWACYSYFDGKEHMSFNQEELNTIINNSTEYTMKSECTDTEMKFTNGPFTLKDVIDNILKFDKIRRNKTKWSGGGIDLHHVFYEGLFKNHDDTSYNVCWGS